MSASYEYTSTPEVLLDRAFAPNGVVYEIAQQTISEEQRSDILLAPEEVANAIRPTGNWEARWKMAENAPSAVKNAVANKEVEKKVLDLATAVGMRNGESLPANEVQFVERDALIYVESGANKTGAVRPALAEELALQKDVPIIYQHGSGRPIPQEKDGKLNPEWKIAKEVAPDWVKEGEGLTELGLNLACALQDGYKITSDNRETDIAERVVRLRKDGMPERVLVQPYRSEETGLEDGLSAIAGLVHEAQHPVRTALAKFAGRVAVGLRIQHQPTREERIAALAEKAQSLQGKQIVTVSNGQYVPKDEAQVRRWAKNHGVAIAEPIGFGDQPGYVAKHAGKQIMTAARGPMIYLNELIILWRQQQAAKQE